MVLFAENDLQLKASYGSSPPCTPFLRVTSVIHMCKRDSRICVTYIVCAMYVAHMRESSISQCITRYITTYITTYIAHTYADYVCMQREVSYSHDVCMATHTYWPYPPTYFHTSLCPFFRSCHILGRRNECRSACHLQKKKN